MLFHALVAVVGFEASSYTVRRDEGDVEVCVVVKQSVTIDFPFQLMFSGACNYVHAHMVRPLRLLYS